MENKEKAKKITKGPKVEQNKNLIIGWSIILILILFIIIYLILNKSGNKNLMHKPSLSANVSSVDFSSCSKDSEESCEYTETRDGKTIKVNYFINNGEDIESNFITINDEIVLINDFYKLNNKIYFLDDIIILSVEDLEQTNTIMYMLDLDGKELKKIEHIDETASGMRISGFTVKGKEIIIDATNLVDEFHYLRLDNEGEEHLYVCNFKDNNFTGKEVATAKYIINYKGGYKFSEITIDDKSITTLNDYVKTINCDEEPKFLEDQEQEQEDIPVTDEPVE